MAATFRYMQHVKVKLGFYAGFEGYLYDEIITEVPHPSEPRSCRAYSISIGDEVTDPIFELHLELVEEKKKPKEPKKLFKIIPDKEPTV